jgi:type IV pilus assembly protein PilW
MRTTHGNARSPQAGFTLVELMVGMAIGLLATVVIIQVMSVFDAQRRSTTGSADAQTNGGIALHTISRDLQMAGYPLFPATDSPLECTTLTFGATGITSISPVTITNGAVSDSITIRYGTSPMGGVPSQITATGPVAIGSTLGCSVGDISLVNTGPVCAMSSVTAVGSATTLTLQNNTGAVAGANLSCLGAWTEITYAVNAAILTGPSESTTPAPPPPAWWAWSIYRRNMAFPPPPIPIRLRSGSMPPTPPGARRR